MLGYVHVAASLSHNNVGAVFYLTGGAHQPRADHSPDEEVFDVSQSDIVTTLGID